MYKQLLIILQVFQTSSFKYNRLACTNSIVTCVSIKDELPERMMFSDGSTCKSELYSNKKCLLKVRAIESDHVSKIDSSV